MIQEAFNQIVERETETIESMREKERAGRIDQIVEEKESRSNC